MISRLLSRWHPTDDRFRVNLIRYGARAECREAGVVPTSGSGDTQPYAGVDEALDFPTTKSGVDGTGVRFSARSPAALPSRAGPRR